MRKSIAPLILSVAASALSLPLAACNTVEGAAQDVESVADALTYDPARTYAACGTYGAMDRNNDGRISNAEYNDYRTGAYAMWDVNHDGRISRAEYANCWYGGGFYTGYRQSAYEPSWTAFDANGDGYLSADEYWSSAYYPSLDKNGDGVVDSSEWPW
jgi:predicted small secreted protein